MPVVNGVLFLIKSSFIIALPDVGAPGLYPGDYLYQIAENLLNENGIMLNIKC